MMRHGPASRSDSGFTLVEVLVSLSLLVIMLALITGAMRFGSRVWEVGDQTERTQAVTAFRNLLGQRLTESLPLMSSDERGVLQLAFAGTGDAVNFLSPLPSRDGMPAGLFAVTLRLVTGQDGARRFLSLEFQPVGAANAAATSAGHRPVLLGGVTHLAVRYYGFAKGAAEPKWLDVWQDQTVLPRLVAVDVGFPPGDVRNWPPFTAELKLGSQLRPQL